MRQQADELQKVSSYIPPELHARLVADAKQQKRSISAQVHYIIAHYYQNDNQK